MKNIITQDGCWNCRHHIGHKEIWGGYADWPSWFCNIDKDCPAAWPNWALCNEDGSELAKYDENFKTLNEDVLIDRNEKIFSWTKAHEVEPYQKCDVWEAQK